MVLVLVLVMEMLLVLLVVLDGSVLLLVVVDRLPSSLAMTLDYLYTSPRKPLAPFCSPRTNFDPASAEK